jgi:hypothetical protein
MGPAPTVVALANKAHATARAAGLIAGWTAKQRFRGPLNGRFLLRVLAMAHHSFSNSKRRYYRLLSDKWSLVHDFYDVFLLLI